MALTDKLTAIADAIRGKTGKTDGLTLDAMPGEIAGIQTGGGGLNIVRGTATVTATTNIIQHNAGFKNYIWHAWASELPDSSINSNFTIEYIYFVGIDNPLPKYRALTTCLRYNPSTGSYTNSVSSVPGESNENMATLGSAYGPHTSVSWNWEVISLDDYI